MILLAGGTKDSRLIAEKLLEKNCRILVTTATEYGAQLISNLDLEVKVGKLGLEELESLLKKQKITKVVDGTHPYAIEISKNLMEVSKRLGLPYYRYERSMIEYKKDYEFYTLDSLIKYIEKLDGNILLTLGSNNIHKFQEIKNKKNLYIRILPTDYAIKKCELAGFRPSQIIGLQGPFSEEFNMAIYKNYSIEYVVTKESGKTGGEYEKVKAASNLGVEVVVLKRPKIEYLCVDTEINKLVERATK